MWPLFTRTTVAFIALLSLSEARGFGATVGLSIGPDESCPSGSAIRDALVRLAPTAQFVPEGALSDIRIRVEDLGASYDVAVGSVVRSVEDPERRCEERARTIALMAAMVVDPPQLGDGSVPSRSVPPPLPLPSTKPYPWALLDRPLVAPKGVSILHEEVTLGAIGPSIGIGATELLSFEAGVGHRIQIGSQFAFPLIDRPQAGTAVASIQVSINRNAAFRFEGGYERATAASSIPNVFYNADGGILSVAFPAKWKLHRMVGLTGGGGSGLRSLWLVNYGAAYSSASPYLSEGLFTIRFSPFNPSPTLYSAFIPLGLLVQPHRIVALHFQTGLRTTFADYSLNSIYVPLDLDVVVTPHPNVDLGASLDIAGDVGGSPARYVALINAGLFVRLRFKSTAPFPN